MAVPDETLTPDLDLSVCDREPIHIPGSIQPHGMLLVLDGPGLTVSQASKNLEQYLPCTAEDALGKPLDSVLGPLTDDLRKQIERMEIGRNAVYLSTLSVGDKQFRAVAHRSGSSLVLELEPASSVDVVTFGELDPAIRGFLSALSNVASVLEMSSVAARDIRRITGFDRVLVYRFDEDWNGTVIAEDRNQNLPSYMDLRFPASDIPAQARELYRLNRLRLIADAQYTPVPVIPAAHPVTGAPLDMSFSVLRSVSPVHIQYMRNMGTAASMSVSILHNGSLWGLISCHHATPLHVPFEARIGCDMVAQILSLQIAARERQELYEYSIRLKSIEAKLLSYMAEENDFAVALAGHAEDLLGLANAQGAAVLTGDNCRLIGSTPPAEFVRKLALWISERGGEEVFHTDCLGTVWEESKEYAGPASGVLTIAISKLYPSYVMWFRPEVVQTVKWGGDPRKPVSPDPNSDRLSPRKSFELWKEIVRGQSTPWLPSEVEAATELRNAIVGIVLRQAEELAEVSGELERSNKELEAFSYSVSHDLRAPFRHIVGYAELLRESLSAGLDATPRRYIDTIIESAQYAGQLVDNLLSFSQIGRTTLQRASVDMNVLVASVKSGLREEIGTRAVEWKIDPLPRVSGDPVLLRLAWQNLLSNAIKYTRGKEPACIVIGCTSDGREHTFFVRDNGAGFEMQYVDKLFGVFQRLHRMEEFEGTGIGLANVRRIVARHGGRTWAHGAPNEGATFYFTLPRDAEKGR